MKRWILPLLALVALVLAIVLNLMARRPFGYDYDFYHEGVEYLFNTGRIPDAGTCWVCAHPPLYFILGAPFYALGRWLGGTPAKGLHMLGLLSILCMGVALFYSYRILKQLRIDRAGGTWGMAVALFMPLIVITSFATEADVLLIALLVACLSYVVELHLRYRTRGLKASILIGLLGGAALMTKYSGILGAIAAAVVLVPHLNRREWKSAVVRGAIIGVLTLAPFSGKLISNQLHHGQLLYANGSASSGFALTARQHWNRYDFWRFRPGEVVDLYRADSPNRTLTDFPVYYSVPTTLHAMMWSDMSFFSNRYRHGDGTHPYDRKEVPLTLVRGLLWLGLLPTAIAGVGLVLFARRRRFLPLTAFLGATAVFYLWWVTGQDSWALKTKYILFLLPVYLVFFGMGWRVLRRRLPRWGWVLLSSLLALLLAGTFAYDLVFALG